MYWHGTGGPTTTCYIDGLASPEAMTGFYNNPEYELDCNDLLSNANDLTEVPVRLQFDPDDPVLGIDGDVVVAMELRLTNRETGEVSSYDIVTDQIPANWKTEGIDISQVLTDQYGNNPIERDPNATYAWSIDYVIAEVDGEGVDLHATGTYVQGSASGGNISDPVGTHIGAGGTSSIDLGSGTQYVDRPSPNQDSEFVRVVDYGSPPDDVGNQSPMDTSSPESVAASVNSAGGSVSVPADVNVQVDIPDVNVQVDIPDVNVEIPDVIVDLSEIRQGVGDGLGDFFGSDYYQGISDSIQFDTSGISNLNDAIGGPWTGEIGDGSGTAQDTYGGLSDLSGQLTTIPEFFSSSLNGSDFAGVVPSVGSVSSYTISTKFGVTMDIGPFASILSWMREAFLWVIRIFFTIACVSVMRDTLHHCTP
jgi:hypothetical protein